MFLNNNLKFTVFNKCLWLNLREKRLSIVNDLIQSEKVLNLTKQKVIDLLGFEFNDIHSNVWTYYLGRRYPVVFSKKKYLYIYFNEEEKAFKVTIK